MAGVARVARALRATPDVVNALLSNGVSEHIIRAMLASPEHEGLASDGISLLVALGASSSEAAAILRSQGALEAVVSCLAKHPSNHGMIKTATQAVELLSSADDMLTALSCIRGVTKITADAVTHVAGLTLINENVELLNRHNGTCRMRCRHLLTREIV